MLWSYGRRHLLIVELDFEIKGYNSIFNSRAGIYEEHRQQVIQPEVLIKRGFMEKERNITQSLEKNNGLVKFPEGPTEEDDEGNSSFSQSTHMQHMSPKEDGTRFTLPQQEEKKDPKKTRAMTFGGVGNTGLESGKLLNKK